MSHPLARQNRAQYGEQVLARLSAELDMSLCLLYQMLEVYRAFPILHPRATLNAWRFPPK